MLLACSYERRKPSFPLFFISTGQHKSFASLYVAFKLMPEGLKQVSFHDQYLQVEQCMHSPICRLGVRAGTGNSVVLRGLSIAGKRENSNDRVTTNGPNFFVQHPLTEIQRKTDRNLWLVLIQGQSKSIHGHPDLVNPAVVECKM